MLRFATVDDLQSGWRELDAEETMVADTLLERASAKIVTLLNQHHIQIDTSDEVQMVNLTAVTCNMVKRVFLTAGNGIQSVSQGIGATNASLTFLNPDESLYLTKSDRETLGLAGGVSKYRAIQAHNWADEAPTIRSGVPFSIATMQAVDNG